MMSEAIAKAIAEVTRPSQLGSPTIKQPTFDWEAPDKYTELKHLR